jgi:hypothetical protein
MLGDLIKKQVILHAQQLDLIFSQSDTLYELIPHAPRLLINPSNPT